MPQFFVRNITAHYAPWGGRKAELPPKIPGYSNRPLPTQSSLVSILMAIGCFVVEISRVQDHPVTLNLFGRKYVVDEGHVLDSTWLLK
jgi:hypothetical protein